MIMRTLTHKLLTGLFMLTLIGGLAVPCAEALSKDGKTVVKQAGVGAAAGGILGGISGESSVLKGVGVGALSGAGTGLIDTRPEFDRHPLVKSTAKGAVIGAGAGSLTGKGLGTGAAVGAGVGAGAHFLRKIVDD